MQAFCIAKEIRESLKNLCWVCLGFFFKFLFVNIKELWSVVWSQWNRSIKTMSEYERTRLCRLIKLCLHKRMLHCADGRAERCLQLVPVVLVRVLGTSALSKWGLNQFLQPSMSYETRSSNPVGCLKSCFYSNLAKSPALKLNGNLLGIFFFISVFSKLSPITSHHWRHQPWRVFVTSFNSNLCKWPTEITCVYYLTACGLEAVHRIK